ncbi:MAG TPA: galactose-1-phosphate uridylyltransferase [candidate division Zixibacteria bacterium]|nr:galactose-1-phosphate uridylyltransferase [candidate division Zixibacteria bacterium]MDD4917665.1 galactose-1-phosphate uridylyltransferase [candidate division Zixibacteria bacterium]MDM7974069.1 galactose-1-phosphate uridylyltransferase [candidate division Zixibacteria bacterium]HOZ06666.1 galactose-1-phosphate uridylyltransferase [candidate division Zixibacteria bacterium]HPC11393.1 galactose-1-phosphate uridylyltransferase [candidate division Zixibacteria bacterium]
MSEFRQNKATKEWVVVAPGRGRRPSDFAKETAAPRPLPEYRDDCPFCPGHEDQTPATVLQLPPHGPWRVRVAPNKFAALSPSLPAARTAVGSFLSANGFGIAEVIVESPRHNQTLATMSVAEVTEVLTAYRERQRAASRNPHVNLVTVFRNHGRRAGTSLEHPHSQLIATPIVPPHVRDPLRQAVLHYDSYGTCVYCDMVAEEIRQEERLLDQTPGFVAFCPFAARSPFEARIYPKGHAASFTAIGDDAIAELAAVLRSTLRRLYFLLGNPDYNYIIRSSPVGDEDTRHLHWYIVIIPKISTPAGFEIGSGIYINSVAPESAARALREVDIDGAREEPA